VHLALQLSALDEGIDQFRHLALLGDIELVQGEQAPAQPAVALLRCQTARRRAPEQRIDAHPETGRDGGQQVAMS